MLVFFLGFESMNCGLLALDMRRSEGCLHKCLRSLLDRCLDEMTVYQKGEPFSDVVPLLLLERRCTSPITYPRTSHHYPFLHDLFVALEQKRRKAS